MHRILRTAKLYFIFAVCVCNCVVSLPICAAERAPTSAEIVTAASKTAERLKRENASWTVVYQLASQRPCSVRITSTPNQRLWEFFSTDSSVPLPRIISRDGVWYVRDGDRNYKCRPYEACFEDSNTIVLLARSELWLWTQADTRLGEFVALEKDIATFRVSFPETMSNQLQRHLEKLRAELKTLHHGSNPEIEKQIADLEHLKREGLKRLVDVSSGIIVGVINPTSSLRTADFQWNPHIEVNAFAVDATAWEDLTKPWQIAPDRIAVASYSRARRPVKSNPGEAVLLNLDSGEIRRIPFKSGTATTGCLSRDRKKAYVLGSTFRGENGVFEIELDSGENRTIIGPVEPGSGSLHMPSLSPDNRMMAVLGRFSGNAHENQVCLIDIHAGKIQKLGTDLSIDRLSWLPDGKGLLVSSSPVDKSGKRGKTTICRLGLDGRLTELFQGWCPVTLGATSRMLFDYFGGEYDQWTLCDFDGRRPQRLGNGYKDYLFPSSSPDGKQVLMIRLGENQETSPIIVDVASGESKLVPAPRGSWAHPVWK
jgi:hypothetical protein